MDILLLAVNDWANLGFNFAKALKAVGADACMVLRFGRRSYAYSSSNRGVRRNSKQIINMAKDVKIIQFIHSQYINIGSVKNKRIFVCHGGTKYRQDPDEINKIFNPIVEKTIIQTGDLLGLGAKNEIWVLAPVDTKKIQPVYNINEEKIIINHFPSMAKNKGTKIINGVMKKLNDDSYIKDKIYYNFSSKRVIWEKNLERISKCDIYIEMLVLEQCGKKYGEWGVTALEAAALGKIVITNFQSLERYKKEYGECPLIIINSGEELEQTVKQLISMSKEELLKIKKNMRKWVEDLHSYKAIGQRLKKKVYNI